MQSSRLVLFSSNYDTTHGMSSYMVVPFWISFAIVVTICVLGKCCLVPVVKACEFELGSRKYQRYSNKTTLIQQAIVQRSAEIVIKESYEKIEQQKIKDR